MNKQDIEGALARSVLLDEACGVGLWEAVLPSGQADHPEAKWRWSPEFRRLMGFHSEADFPNVMESWSSRLHPDDVDATFAAFAGHIEDITDQTRYDVRYRLKVADGTYRWFRATGGCRHLEDGLVRACGSLSDVHETVIAQQETARAAARIKLMEDASGVGLWSALLVESDAMHPESKWEWSPEFRRLLGYDNEQDFPNVVQSWSDRLHPDDVEATFAAFGGHLQDLTDQTQYDVKYRLKVRDGSYRWFRATGGCRHLDDGLVQACGSLSDIHDGHIAQQQTARAAARIELMEDASGVGLWSALLVDSDAMHPESQWEWSPEFRRLLGYDNDQEFPNVVQSWSDRLHPDDAEATFAAFGGHLEDLTDQTRYDVKYRLKVRDGSYRWFRATGGCRHLPDGLVQACGSLSDIHDGHMAQQQTARAAARIELMEDASGVGLWSALLVESDAMHPESQWEWSPEFRRLIGYDNDRDFPNEVNSWAGRLHPDDVESTFAAFAGHLEDLTDQTRYDVRYRLKVADGSYRWFRATGGCRHLPDGKVQACGSLSDIHDATMMSERIEREAAADQEAMQAISERVAQVANGDLTATINVDVPEKIEGLKTDFNAMADSLSNLIDQVKDTANNMRTESFQIAQGAQDLAKRCESQAAAVEETAAAVEQMSGNISTTTESARESADVATSAKDRARKGSEIVSQVIAAMEEIEAHTRKMSDITEVIEGFAFQTNLLSINAAIEAARAGDVGRGFAVVASEVRNLAQQSAQASQNIGELIKQSETDVKRGVSLVREAGVALEEITGSVSAVAESIEGIAHATAEQAVGVREINSAITEIDRLTQDNLGLAGDSASSATELSSQIDGMSEMVATFTTSGANISLPGMQSGRAA